MGRAAIGGQQLGQRGGGLDREEAHAVLFVPRQFGEHRQHLGERAVAGGTGDGGAKHAQLLRRGAAHHGRVVARERAKEAPQLSPSPGAAGVAGGEEAGGGDAGGPEFGACEALWFGFGGGCLYVGSE